MALPHWTPPFFRLWKRPSNVPLIEGRQTENSPPGSQARPTVVDLFLSCSYRAGHKDGILHWADWPKQNSSMYDSTSISTVSVRRPGVFMIGASSARTSSWSALGQVISLLPESSRTEVGSSAEKKTQSCTHENYYRIYSASLAFLGNYL